jgi:hypothetical protein
MACAHAGAGESNSNGWPLCHAEQWHPGRTPRRFEPSNPTRATVLLQHLTARRDQADDARPGTSNSLVFTRTWWDAYSDLVGRAAEHAEKTVGVVIAPLASLPRQRDTQLCQRNGVLSANKNVLKASDGPGARPQHM